jgi:hypothetical protein
LRYIGQLYITRATLKVNLQKFRRKFTERGISAMKKRISFALSAVLALSLSLPAVMAKEEPVIDPSVIFNTSDTAMPLPATMYGTIIDENGGDITVQNLLNENDVVVLHIQTTTCVVDAVTGMSAALKDRESDLVAVFYGPFVSMSMPPQSNAVAIAVNLPENNFSPHYAKAESVTQLEDGVQILADNGSLFVRITPETKLLPYLTRNIVLPAMIVKGSELIVWYDIVAMSFPGQTNARIAVLLRGPSEDAAGDVTVPEIPSGEIPEASGELQGYVPNTVEQTNPIEITALSPTGLILWPNEGVIRRADGIELDLGADFSASDPAMRLPARSLCEMMGYVVSWDEDSSTGYFFKDGDVFTVTLDSAVCTVNGEAVQLGYKPVILGESMWLPLSFYMDIMKMPIAQPRV